MVDPSEGWLQATFGSEVRSGLRLIQRLGHTYVSFCFGQHLVRRYGVNILEALGVEIGHCYSHPLEL